MRRGRRWWWVLAVMCAVQVPLCRPVDTSAMDAVDRGHAAADAYALSAVPGRGLPASLAWDGVAPVAPARAVAPPTLMAAQRNGTQGCDAATGRSCARPVRSLQVTDDAVVATLRRGIRSCLGTTTTSGPVLAPPAAESCNTIAHVEVGEGPTAIVADSVESRSTTEGCDRPEGHARIGSLRVGDVTVVSVAQVVHCDSPWPAGKASPSTPNPP